MILLDTNVVSEAMKPSADARVLRWLDAQSEDTLWISCITLAEVDFGISCLPDGRRRRALARAFDEMLVLFGTRVLAFDEAAARAYGRVASQARAVGRPLPFADGCIAAIAAAHGHAVASRDTDPYEAAGLVVFDPWRDDTAASSGR